MGMFDSVYVACPKCTAQTEFQSKAGECSLMNYDLMSCPPEILTDLYEQGDGGEACGSFCPKCGHQFVVQRPDDIQLRCTHVRCNGLIGAERPRAEGFDRVLDYWYKKFAEHVKEHSLRHENCTVMLWTPSVRGGSEVITKVKAIS